MSGDIDMRKEPTESGSSVLVPGADGILYSRSPYSKEYKIAVARLEKAIQDISNGIVWDESIGDMPKFIKFDFIYPNGKNGDIDMYIASEYGQVRQKATLIYEVEISTEYKEQIALMNRSYISNFHPKTQANLQLYRCEISNFLEKYNTYFSLSLLNRAAIDVGMCVTDPLRKQADSIRTNYMGKLRDNRRQIYAELVSHGLTTAKWKSEQQAYAIIKNLYPDAIYQYKAAWLGFQSLDVFIPNMKIGIEYQGAQHYRPVSLFGGDEGLKRRLELDEEKRQKCKAHGVTLIDWRFDEPLTEEFINLKIASANL